MLFSRLEYASNKAAKKKLRHFDSDYVIYTSTLPKDVNFWKLLAYTLLLGIFGGHYYYTGKYVKGILNSACFVYLVFCTIFNQFTSQTELMFLPVGIYAFAYLVSVAYVISRKFKVPVIVDTVKLEAEKSGIKAEYDALKAEIKEEKQKLKESRKQQKKQAKEQDKEQSKTESKKEEMGKKTEKDGKTVKVQSGEKSKKNEKSEKNGRKQ